jgi:hypothetical protein
MTWGQLRLQLQIFGPGISADLLDEYLNSRYTQALEATDGQGLHYPATVQTIAAYQSANDTVNPNSCTFTVGSASVVGASSLWTAAGANGMKIYRPGDTAIYTATWVSATALTLDRPYEGVGTDAPGTIYAASAYVLMQNVYALPADVRSVDSMLDPVSGLPLQKMTKDELDAAAGVRTLVGNPGAYALDGDSNEQAGPVLHEVEFYPPPLYARGIPFHYLHAAVGFDGANTSGSPLPFLSDVVLLYGCRADIAAHLENWQGVAFFEGKFQEELKRLMLLEHAQRRKKPVMRMAGRFTRHRMERTGRGLETNWQGGTPGGPD